MRRGARRIVRWTVLIVAAWAAVAYLALPAFWRHYEHLPAMERMPRTTTAPDGLPGDALNVALVGIEAEVTRALGAAGWVAASPVTVQSGVGIAESVLLDRPDPAAPMSDLLLFGRRQDLAFEQQVGTSARQRHHVRFWRSDVREAGDRPVWVGAATFDRGVGLSRTTAQITHHIAPDIDAERDLLMDRLVASGQLAALYQVTGVGPTVYGRNGGGDRYVTDGEVSVGIVAPAQAAGRARVEVLRSPTPIVVKNRLWAVLRPLLVAAPAAP